MIKLLMVHCLYSPFDFYKSPEKYFLEKPDLCSFNVYFIVPFDIGNLNIKRLFIN